MLLELLVRWSGARRHNGFTLVELMVTIAVLAIIATIAVPSFTSTLVATRIRSAASALQGQLMFARSEAIKRNADVTLTWSSGSAGWSSTTSVGTTTLASSSGTGALATVSSTSVTFQPTGRTTASASVTFEIDQSGGGSGSVRCVVLRSSGAPSVCQNTCAEALAGTCS